MKDQPGYIRKILTDPHVMARTTYPELDGSVLDDDEQHRIRLAVESLPENVRDVIELVFWAQSGGTEIATRLGISRSSVYRYMEQGRAMLTELLSGDD